MNHISGNWPEEITSSRRAVRSTARSNTTAVIHHSLLVVAALRDASLMAGSIALGACLLSLSVLVVGIVSCSHTNSMISAVALAERAKGGEISFETIERGQYSRLLKNRLEVIGDKSAWHQFWTMHATPSTPTPLIDFQKETVIVVLLAQSAGGHAVTITKIENRLPGLQVSFDEVKSELHCSVATVLTQPHHIVKLPKIEGEVIFVRNERIESC